jgi:hypothetical protein
VSVPGRCGAGSVQVLGKQHGQGCFGAPARRRVPPGPPGCSSRAEHTARRATARPAQRSRLGADTRAVEPAAAGSGGRAGHGDPPLPLTATALGESVHSNGRGHATEERGGGSRPPTTYGNTLAEVQQPTAAPIQTRTREANPQKAAPRPGMAWPPAETPAPPTRHQHHRHCTHGG